MRVVSLADIRLNVASVCACGHAEGALDGIEGLVPGERVLVLDHPRWPVFEVKVALDDSAIVEELHNVSFSLLRRIDADY
jgi:hypothetical protein